jgi:hypothetical protein
MTNRTPLTELQCRVNAAAWTAYPQCITPADEEMRGVCESLLHRGLLVAIANDAGEGYLANPALMEAVEQKVGLN